MILRLTAQGCVWFRVYEMPELLQGPREFPKMLFLKYTINLQLYKDVGLTTPLMYQGF